MQKDSTLLDLNLCLTIDWLRRTLAVFLRYDLDVNTVHATDKLCFENGFAFLLAAFVTRTRAAAVNAGGDGDAIDFEGFVTVDQDKYAVQTIGEGNGHLGRDLQVGVARRDDDGGTMLGFLLVCGDIDGPRLGEVERWVGVQRNLRDQSLFNACLVLARMS